MSDNDLIRRGVIKERMIARGWKHPDSTVTEFVEDDLPAVPTDGDLVSRNWLLAEYDRQHEGSAGKARKLIEAAPAVPHEMSAREYIREYRRMCDFYFGKPATDGGVNGCGDCPGRLNGKKNCIFSPTRDESSIPIVDAWAREHPEERSE